MRKKFPCIKKVEKIAACGLLVSARVFSARVKIRRKHEIPTFPLGGFEILVRIEKRNRENHGVGCLEKFSVVLVRQQELFFAAFLFAKGEEVAEIVAHFFHHFFGRGSFETVYRVKTIPAS